MKVDAYVNSVITASIPISKDLKRYLLSRYRKLVHCNGPKYAADVFKNASEVCLRYRADPSRLDNLDLYLRELPFTRKGWNKAILHYMDCQPMMMLDFLKLYVGNAQPLVTVEESATAQQAYLEETETRVDTHVPGILRYWVRFLKLRLTPEYHLIVKTMEPDTYFGRLFRRLSYDTLREYQRKWRKILMGFHVIGNEESAALLECGCPVPESYKDFVHQDDSSKRLDEDYWSIIHIAKKRWATASFGKPLLSDESVDFLRSYLSSDERFYDLLTEEGGFFPWFPEAGVRDLCEATVGEIQHIPKKGTVKRRPIAVPNRFLQQGLRPMQRQLECIIQRLPCDCTFNQARFDVKIANRVTNPGLYVGSVDLSQATDNLPSDWGWFVWDELFAKKLETTVTRSATLFREMSRAEWDNHNAFASWPVGQPLGTLPSFGMLALTHNCLLEALSLSLGMVHSPYSILGDDLLVFNKKVRSAYISLMESAGIPLSLQKSYEGNLVEFAGKVFIRNQVPAYRSDHAPISWNSLFDYQRCTGVAIPWDKLPRQLKRKFSRVVVTAGFTADDSRRVYNLIQILWVRVNFDPSWYSNVPTGLAANFYLAVDESENQIPDPILSSGIVRISGHPVTLGAPNFADKDGHLIRFRPVSLPPWFKEKVRPCTTDKLVASAVSALKQDN